MTSLFGNRAALGSAALLFASLSLTACNDASAHQELSETKNFSAIKVDNKKYLDQLNQWLKDNPGRRITSFSGELQYRDGVSRFIVEHESGSGLDQKFISIPNDDDTVALDRLQQMHNRYRITALTTVPKSGGGTKEWILCIEAKKAPSK